MNLIAELETYLNGLTIHGDNIGNIRRACSVPWDSEWNGIVRDLTAQREKSELSAAEKESNGRLEQPGT